MLQWIHVQQRYIKVNSWKKLYVYIHFASKEKGFKCMIWKCWQH
jgi:hypothetical protein